MSPSTLVHDTATGRFKTGSNGYKQRLAARDRIRAGLEADYDFTSPTAVLLLPIIVQNLFDAERARRKNDRVRSANAARRLLAQLSKKEPLWP
jgi:hypothetical protein